ncbi:MAG: AAA family ATPase [Terracidiphilus sp.]|nr:AAA family ATPase [Terracidiphilus sp.]
MLTRLKVNGFKNLVGVDVQFGPFTCIAGANGVGKSNLFDAITFLSNLADKSLLDAALSVRDDGSHTGDLRSIFHCVGNKSSSEMTFEAELIIPQTGEDDLGQPAKATTTFLKYTLKLGYRADNRPSTGGIEILYEELNYITQRDAKNHLAFNHSSDWRKSVVFGRRSGKGYITTASDGDQVVIKVHQDNKIQGRASRLPARTLPRTTLSVANSAESPTALLAKREMQSWKRLQLEPSRLRMPDAFTSPTVLSVDGAHLAANLYALAKSPVLFPDHENDNRGDLIYTEIANKLSGLIDDVKKVDVDVDEKRQLYTLVVTGRDNTRLTARSLSDGTLRFLALGILQMDPRVHGLICLEEPENGIHPERIPAMLRLLCDIASDVNEPASPENPLRQVIINTHSPAVVADAPDESVLMAEPISLVDSQGIRFTSIGLRPLANTWRANEPGYRPIALGNVLAYLDPLVRNTLPQFPYDVTSGKMVHRVIDRPDVQESLFGEKSA